MTEKSQFIDTRLTAHDQAVRLMAAWISAIADQVRNPVAGISAAANLIEKQMTAFRSAQQWDPAIVEEAVRLMLERLSTFDNYLTELSGFTRTVTLDSKWLSFRDEWHGIEQFMVRRIPLNFRVMPNISGDGKIYVDSERLKSSLLALALNSAEACGSIIQPEIEISLIPFDDPLTRYDGVLICVIDNGPGFSAAALIQGLTPFFTTKDAGTGLGLAMVEKYVRAHGGWVKIANRSSSLEELHGAVVELFFPNPAS